MLTTKDEFGNIVILNKSEDVIIMYYRKGIKLNKVKVF